MHVAHREPGVAGVNAPAFVERSGSPDSSAAATSSVAGVNAPAFVERTTARRRRSAAGSGVAGVNAPAFVEPYRVSMATENWALVGTEGCSHGLGRQGPDARFRRATPEPMEWTGPFLMLH